MHHATGSCWLWTNRTCGCIAACLNLKILLLMSMQHNEAGRKQFHLYAHYLVCKYPIMAMAALRLSPLNVRNGRRVDLDEQNVHTFILLCA